MHQSGIYVCAMAFWFGLGCIITETILLQNNNLNVGRKPVRWQECNQSPSKLYTHTGDRRTYTFNPHSPNIYLNIYCEGWVHLY